jgi:lipase
MRLHVHRFGPSGAPPVLCLHGVTGHGRRYRRLAEEALPQRFVVAPDLRGHGRSGWEPPWSLETHTDDVLETVAAESIDRIDIVGHSFGGRIALELVARAPGLVQRVVLLDPAIELPPSALLREAEAGREQPAFRSVDEQVRWRLASGSVFHASREALEEEAREHLEPGADGLLRLRYCPSAVIAGYGELARPAPPLGASPGDVLLVLPERNSIVHPDHVAALRRALDGRLDVLNVPGGHSPLWDAFEPTADGVRRFLR